MKNTKSQTNSQDRKGKSRRRHLKIVMKRIVNTPFGIHKHILNKYYSEEFLIQLRGSLSNVHTYTYLQNKLFFGCGTHWKRNECLFMNRKSNNETNQLFVEVFKCSHWWLIIAAIFNLFKPVALKHTHSHIHSLVFL